MKKKQSITQKILDDLGLESPKRYKKKKKKPRLYKTPEYAAHDYSNVYVALKKMLKKHSKRFEVQEDETTYYLKLPATKDRKPVLVFGVGMNKGYVSFYHTALYDPNYDKTFPKKLNERRHGQTALNFIEIDKPLFKLLEKEVERVIDLCEKSGYFDEPSA